MYYEPLYEDDPGDPVELIRSDIRFAEVESVNFISGFRGSGKTTELFRLRKCLEEDGHYVAYANALDYMPPSAAIDVSDFLINLAGAFSDAVEKDAGFDAKHERWWTRVVHYLRTTKVEIGIQRDSLLKDRSAESVRRMTFLLDTHCALILLNGREWFDVHPIIRADVEQIVKRHAGSSPTKP